MHIKQGDLIQEQMLSELIYEGEIHRLIKKNILIYVFSARNGIN